MATPNRISLRQFLIIVALASALPLGGYILRAPYVQYVNGDLSNVLTSAIIHREGLGSFAGDYVWGHGISNGKFSNWMFAGSSDSSSIENLYAHHVESVATAVFLFLFFLGCLLLVTRWNASVPIGFALALVLLNGGQAYMEGWSIGFNTYGVTANLYNCLFPLFIYALCAQEKASLWVGILIFLLCLSHPASALAFSVAAFVYFGLYRRWREAMFPGVALLAGMMVSWMLNVHTIGSFHRSPALLEFVTTRIGSRFFFFPGDNTTLLPSSGATYRFIVGRFISSYWLIYATVILLAVLRRKSSRILLLTQEGFAILKTAVWLTPLAILGALFSRFLFLISFRPIFLALETIRIERLSWPLYIFGLFLMAVPFLKRISERPVLTRYALTALVTLGWLLHFNFCATERPVLSVAKNTLAGLLKPPHHLVIAQAVISSTLQERYEAALELRKLSYPGALASEDLFLRVALRKPIYFSWEDGPWSYLAGQDTAELWLTRLHAVDEAGSDPNRIASLLAGDLDFGGAIIHKSAHNVPNGKGYSVIPLGAYSLITRPAADRRRAG